MADIPDPADATTAPPFEGTTWHLRAGVVIPSGTTVSIRFAGGTASGSTGVNRFRADYRLEGGALELGPAATTLMAGPADRMDAARAFLTLLSDVRGYRVSGQTLVLTGRDDHDLLTFEPAPPVGQELRGRWGVQAVRRGDALLSTPTIQSAWLEFADDGSVTGSTGVNRIGTTARTEGDRLWLGPFRSTRMAGTEEAMADEHLLLTALDGVARWQIEDEPSGMRVRLLDQDDAVQVVLGRMSADS
jgi:putative lipoprotein